MRTSITPGAFHHLPDPTTLVLMVGYQFFGGLSGHAGQKDLLNWVGSLVSSRPRVILTRGEDGPRRALAERIQQRFGLSSEMPAYREVVEF
jgi:metallo-beta-lactamase family protein